MTTHLSLFTGLAADKLAFMLAGIPTRTVGYVEIEPYCQEIIKARIRGLERACYEKRLPYAWGSKRVGFPPKEQMELPLCQSCQLKWEVSS